MGCREPSGRNPSAGCTLGLPYGPLPRGGGGNTCAATDSNTRKGAFTPSRGGWTFCLVIDQPRLLPDSAVHR
jgi:hypothetical protein